MKKIAILGSTGSIGTSTLDVVSQHPEKFKVLALSCGRNVDLLLTQIKSFQPELVSLSQESHIKVLQEKLKDAGYTQPIEILWGEEGAVAVASHAAVDHVVSAMVGAVGLAPTLAAIRSGKEIGLANKETMVVAGEFMNAEAREYGVTILPVDSEHSAIFQCLNGEKRSQVKKIILTASGGPFLHRPQEDFVNITKEQALKHPNWDMGAKITIDSSTLMNKGLELVEARWLFEIEPQDLEVVVHPQSVIHSMVEFQDGSVMAQLGIPDMRTPIAYAMSYPDRLTLDLPRLDLPGVKDLNFFAPDEQKFPCLALAKEVMHAGGTLPAVLNAANEIAVDQFLSEKIGYVQIPELIKEVLERHDSKVAKSLEDIYQADAWARECALKAAA